MIALPPPLRHPVIRSALLALASLLVWGGWAFFANRGHGSGAALTAAGVQGASSLTVTFLMTLLMEGSMRWLPLRLDGWGRMLPVAVVGLGFQVVYTVVWHLVGETPELLMTIAPGVLSGAVYCLLYALQLDRERAG